MATSLVERVCCLTFLVGHILLASCGPLLCSKEGRFPHPLDCGRYVDCIPQGPGQDFVERLGHCHGFPFSPSLRRCVSHEEAPGCAPKEPRSAFHLPELDYLCTADGVGCTHCKLAYACIKGKAHVQVCRSEDICSDNIAFGGGTCLPQAHAVDFFQKCNCSPTAPVVDSYNSSFFLRCDEGRHRVTVESCPSGQIFSEEVRACKNVPLEPVTKEEEVKKDKEDEPKIPACVGRTGTWVNPADCRCAYTCLQDGTTRTTCCREAGQYFDQETRTCVEACSLLRPSATPDLCRSFGLARDSRDCNKYHFCFGIGLTPIRSHRCAEGQYFDEVTRKCRQGDPPRSCPFIFDYASCPQNRDLEC